MRVIRLSGRRAKESGSEGMTRALARLVVIVLVGGVVGCTTPPAESGPDSGPLHYLDEDAVWCAPARLYPEVVLGAPLDLPEGTPPITVGSVEAVNPHGLRITDVYVMPVDPQLRIQMAPFPPDLPGWSRARPGIDAVVEAGESVDLLARVVYEGSGVASVDSLKINYYQNGVLYQADTHVGLRMIDAESCVDDGSDQSDMTAEASA